MAMQCNFHRLPLIVFTNNQQLCTQRKETNQASLLPLDSSDDVGTSCPRDCLIESVCVMQRKVANKVQTIPHQLTGPVTASRLECPTLLSRPLCYRREHELVQNSQNYSHGRRLDLQSQVSSNKHMAIHISRNDQDKTVIQSMLA